MTTAIDSSSSALHRLRLLVHCAEARSLDLILPEDTTVARVRRDGTDVAPIISGTGLKMTPRAESGPRAEHDRRRSRQK